MLIFTILTFFLFGISDWIIYKYQNADQNTRWFFIHSLCNVFIILFTFSDLLLVFQIPWYSALPSSFYEKQSIEPVLFSIYLHIYHVLVFKNLTWVDWLHHILSAFLCGLIAFVYHWGPILNTILFFITGLPGGIDYFLLFLVKLKKIDPMVEKRVNVYLNIFCRMPGLLISSLIGYISLREMALENPFLISDAQYYSCILVCLINVWNGVYFCKRVFHSYIQNVVMEAMTQSRPNYSNLFDLESM